MAIKAPPAAQRPTRIPLQKESQPPAPASPKPAGARRNRAIDTLRGLTILSMILYHGAWDFVYLLGADWPWFSSYGAHIWQQSICWTFILLSGFCWSYSRRPVKRGLMVFGAGLLVTGVTCLFLPEDRIVFGVLTLIGSCMLLTAGLNRLLLLVPPGVGALLSFGVFLCCKPINDGYLGIGALRLMLPESWYGGYLSAFFGFPPGDFFSTDYFSLLPWLFLFLTGYFLQKLLRGTAVLEKSAGFQLKPLALMGRHSMVIYLLHQPLLYAVLVGGSMLLS